jgi:hypothetical protein
MTPPRFCRSSGRSTPSRRRDKIAKPRVQCNPAGIHLPSAGRCPNKRNQLSEQGLATKRALTGSVQHIMLRRMISTAGLVV